MAFMETTFHADVIGNGHPHQVRGLLQDQLGLLCGKGQYLEWLFANLQRRYGELPEEIRTSRFVRGFDRLTCVRELSADSQSRMQLEIGGLKQASQEIAEALEIWNLLAAEGLLGIAGVNLQRADELIADLKSALEAHESLCMEVLEKRNQLLRLDGAVSGLTIRYLSLSERRDGINPSLGGELVSEFAYAICEAGFISGLEFPAVRPFFHLQTDALDVVLDRGRRAFDDCNLLKLSEALGLGAQYISEAAEYLNELESAVCEFELANSVTPYDYRYFPGEEQAFCASPVQLSEHTTQSDDSYKTGKELINEVDNPASTLKDDRNKRLLVDDILGPPPAYVGLVNIPDFNHFVYLDDPEFDYGAGTPTLHHPRPRSLSPKSAVERWMRELTEDPEIE